MAEAALDALAARLGQAAAPSVGLETARQLAELLREAGHREKAKENVFQNLLKILRKATSEVDVACKDASALAHLDCHLLLLSECFRCLRNACVQCPNNQNVMRNLGLIDVSCHLIELLQKLETDLESSLTAFRCSLQFLGNIATGNRDSQERIWKLALPFLFLNCLNHQDEKIVDHCCMILFTCLNPERTRELQKENNLNIALAVLQACRRYPEMEWMTMLLELLLSEKSDKDSAVCKEMGTFLASCFQEKCHSVLRLASAANNEDEEALLMLRLLDALCEMTSNDGQVEHLQTCPDLLETAVSTLQLVHLSGKQTTNVFTATHSATGQEQICHPAVGLKSHLIRLIANLCYKNKANQDKVYELDGIPLILDNCSIDDNNPFISQWSMYAIHNLTEQNERNQELISQLEQRGLAGSSILENMGLKVEKQDKKLILRSAGKMPDL
ncbi:ataxin-10 isoform X2 [Eublepharis macularius]|uniref:Ataxin-10 n=1 Tax=Eublepharis macularius TaxID=481883 RepID=A0AA97KH16_EUBMA|nr:ataxin-10 isoform X2 [Eublepharis macularius]